MTIGAAGRLSGCLWNWYGLNAAQQEPADRQASLAAAAQGVGRAHRNPMTYDLDTIKDPCGELGLRTVPRSDDRVAVELSHGVVLIFVNADKDEDAFIGFEDVG